MKREEEYSNDERFALGMLPHAKKAMDAVREMLPDGTHFGIFVLVPVDEKEWRVVALNTDRQLMAPAIAQWFLSIQLNKDDT